uniref:Uncharacterized protein n=1 Tax=Stomoxys calcitrans TaxID=35570 RepID=A0A1I8NLA1_STOCA
MGIRVFDNNEDVLSDEDCSTCCSCSQATTTTSSGITHKANISSHLKDKAYWDIVDNCKEVTLESNTSNLRIIGNNNRIYITHNLGNLIIIGNNTRLKVQNNHGQIKYTGNDGRISLGSESTQQMVDYIGCNGTLKIVNAMKFSKGKKCTAQSTVLTKKNKTPACRKYGETTAAATKKTSFCCCCKKHGSERKFVEIPEMKSTSNTKASSANRNPKSKEKSHSYGGPSCHSEQTHWETFSMLFKNMSKNSMPNLNSMGSHTEEVEGAAYCSKPNSAKNIVQTIENIVISNASNICISPYVRNITTQA